MRCSPTLINAVVTSNSVSTGIRLQVQVALREPVASMSISVVTAISTISSMICSVALVVLAVADLPERQVDLEEEAFRVVVSQAVVLPVVVSLAAQQRGRR